ncbi:DUF3575 domain-containing protein [Flavobacterium sp.]|uniref:DUF3575 domain-containing protein n=1 Tax=Flavobacterium sp. TaxID=239 RepID=UPI002610B655|nr:DUF3575 domain-containing protein [Flavobacterium sp.]
MKKLILLLWLGSQWIHAQDTIPKSPLLSKRNEVRVDVLALATSRLNITYERFLNKNFSVGVSGIYSNNKKNKDDFDEGNVDFFSKYELIPFVRYNLSQGARSFYFAEIFADANGGDFREIVLLSDATNNNYYAIEKSKYNDLGLGAAVGYKYYIKDQFGIEFLVGFGSNLFNKDKSPDILSRVGLGVSYRF